MNQVLEQMEAVRHLGLASGLDITPWLTERQHANAVWRDGRVVESAFTRSQLFRLSVVDDRGSRRTVSGTALPDPHDVVGLVTKLPAWSGPAPTAAVAALPRPVPGAAPPPDRGALAALAGQLSRPAPDHVVEVRVEEVRDAVTAVLPAASAGYTTGRYAVQVRVTSVRGARSSRESWIHAVDLHELGTTAAARREEMLRHAALPVTDDVPSCDAELLVRGEVAAQLLALASKAFSAEVVLSGRSPFTADSVGRPVAAPGVDVVDDARLPGGPRSAVFDDEGTPGGRVDLVDAGALRAYLGSSSTQSLPASAAGCTWSPDRMAPPRPAGSNLVLRAARGVGAHVADATDVTGDVVHQVVECQGLHMANDITGDFAMSTSVEVGRGSNFRRMEQVMLSGNVFVVLRRATPVGGPLSWFAGTSSHYGSPDLVVRGLRVSA